uniref:Uncharacterized protein n=1 Tax=Arundo donax TaxID=35708 RepID=A0A0A8Z5T5_ARUDO
MELEESRRRARYTAGWRRSREEERS